MSDSGQDDKLFPGRRVLDPPPTVDRRSFLMRNAVIGAAAVMTGNDLDARGARPAGREGSGAAQNSARPSPPTWTW